MADQTTGRPFILDPFFRRVTGLDGIGPRNAKLIAKLTGGDKVFNLLTHLPHEIIDRRQTPKIKETRAGQIATITMRVEKHNKPPRRSLPYRVTCSDDSGKIDLIFFHARGDYLEKQLPIGAEVIVSGRIEHYRGQPQMPHPDAIGGKGDFETIARVEPVYPLTAGLTNKTLVKAVRQSLSLMPVLPEWQDSALTKRERWPPFHDALRAVHDPQDETSLDPDHPARRRLAYDELLADQLALAIVRQRARLKKGRVIDGGGLLRQKLLDNLPFTLTGAQERSLSEIAQDMKDPHRMLRLLQGDVGSGKTIVAALAMLNAVECGAQAALMAPTEILARQHAETLGTILAQAGVRMVTLSGRDKGKARDLILEQIADGTAQIVIGTHALFQDDVAFHDLALAVIDEQHRFGVEQRLRLADKGKGVDILVMTATPIPRTLSLTSYGDMDVSRLDEKPPGRKPVDTRLIPKDKIDDMIDGLKRQTKAGARAYWVCPLVEESDILDVAAAQERFEILQAHFGERVGLVHGRMKAEEKDDVMRRFIAGELDVLVATTVIEVGVNVPEATIMVIEHAERFGLAQLHQLRGRVGRGADQSYCFLIYAKTGETARARLKTMRDTEDGFLIAEKDLDLRGSGEVLGTRQSGLPQFRLARLPEHKEFLMMAHDDARLTLRNDPDLQSDRGKALRLLLYLFARDQGIKNLGSG